MDVDHTASALVRIEADLQEVKTLLRRLAYKNEAEGETRYLTSTEAMADLGYKDRESFWKTVRRENIPHLIINARRIVFPVKAFNDWKAKRQVGVSAS